MKLEPRNRHLLIEPIVEEEKKEENTTNILLPDDYATPPKPYATARVLSVSPSCNVGVSKGDKVLVENSMVQKIEIDDDEFYLVLENYVYGVVSSR